MPLNEWYEIDIWSRAKMVALTLADQRMQVFDQEQANAKQRKAR